MSGLLWWLLTRVLRHRPRREADGYFYGPERTLGPAPLSRPLTVTFEVRGLDLAREAVRRAEQEMQRVAIRSQTPEGLDPHTCRDLALDLWEIEQLPEVDE